MLEARNLEIGYPRRVVMKGIDLQVLPGKVTALLGCNGAGKSTLIRTLSGELPPLGGEVTLDGKPLKSYSARQLSRRLSIVTTEPGQTGGLTVQELVSLGRHPHTGFLGRLGSNDKEIAAKAMEYVGIAHMAQRFVSELSDGERQKCMIARSLAQQAEIILLDEPFSFLDVASKIEILRLLTTIASTDNVAILYSSHDVAQALRMADNIILMSPDMAPVFGTTQEIIETGKIKNLFAFRNVRFDQDINDFVEL